MKKSGYQEINLKLSDIVELIIAVEKEEILYLKAGSEKKVITFKLLYESVQSDYEALKDNKNVIAITKKSKNIFVYVSDLSEEELEEISNIVEEKEEENSPNTDEILKNKILQIINCKTIIRELKEKYDDIEQLIYVLKNQVNFMAFLYLFDRGKKISYDSYSEVYDWYLNLSQDYIRVKEYRYKCDDTSEDYFRTQLQDMEYIYNILYNAWKLIKIDKKFSKNFFNRNIKKIPGTLYKKIIKEEIFSFLQEVDK
jgi:hypothetical protein